MQATARAPGSCGELIQGSINGINFLVTCPVGLYSNVKVSITNDKIITVNTNKTEKITQAVRNTLDLFGLNEKGAQVQIFSEIPRGKGMASSSADISAAIVAVAMATGNEIPTAGIAKLALQIEPSDGIMFSGITLLDHINGKLQEYIGTAPSMEILIVDLGGQVNTMEFNQRKDLALLNKEKENDIKRALAMLKSGFAEQNRQLIAEAATISSFANQNILFKEKLMEIHERALKLGALGVNIAHSGTVIGLLFEEGAFAPVIKTELEDWLEQGSILCNTHIVNGGVEVLTVEGSEPVWEKYSIYTGETYVRPRENMV